MNKVDFISIIMIDGSFREKFHSLKYFSEQDFPKDKFEIIWIEYYNSVKIEIEKISDKFENIRIIKLNKEGEYHSSYCFNEGIKQSRGDLMVIPDADLVVEKDFLNKVFFEHEKNNELAMYIYRANEIDKPKNNEIRSMDYYKKISKVNNPVNYGGCLTVRKKWLLKIDGYDLHNIFSSGFHANGRDVYVRLKNIGLSIKWHPLLRLYHPWHKNTLVSAPTYKIQNKIIDYRDKNLIFLPFLGLSGEKTKIYSEFKDFAEDEIKTSSENRNNIIIVYAKKITKFFYSWGR